LLLKKIICVKIVIYSRYYIIYKVGDILREAIWGYAVIVLGILAIAIIWFFANTTNTDQHNYNLLKEAVEASMFDAIDLSAYRKSGTIKIEEEKFVENFIRRFAENAELSNTYVIEIYDVNEVPPKVSLKVSSVKSTNATGEIINFDIVNNIDAILEAKYARNLCTKSDPCTTTTAYVSWLGGSDDTVKEGAYLSNSWIIDTKTLELPLAIKNLYSGTIKSKPKSASWLKKDITAEDLVLRREMHCEWYNGWYDSEGVYTSFIDENGNCKRNLITLDEARKILLNDIAEVVDASFTLDKNNNIRAYAKFKPGKPEVVNWFVVEWEYWVE